MNSTLCSIGSIFDKDEAGLTWSTLLPSLHCSNLSLLYVPPNFRHHTELSSKVGAKWNCLCSAENRHSRVLGRKTSFTISSQTEGSSQEKQRGLSRIRHENRPHLISVWWIVLPNPPTAIWATCRRSVNRHRLHQSVMSIDEKMNTECWSGSIISARSLSNYRQRQDPSLPLCNFGSL